MPTATADATAITNEAITQTFSRTFPGTTAGASAARGAFREWLHTLHAGTEEECYGLVLAFGEASANAVSHGSPRGERDTVTVAARWDGTTLMASVADQGKGYDRGQVPEPDPLRPGGWGLHLTRTMTDAAWPEFPGIGTIYRFRKRLTVA